MENDLSFRSFVIGKRERIVKISIGLSLLVRGKSSLAVCRRNEISV
jgi:hypothetical protein